MLLVLKMSDYWVQTGEGSEILPEKWVYFSQTFDQTYQVSFIRKALDFQLTC